MAYVGTFKMEGNMMTRWRLTLCLLAFTLSAQAQQDIGKLDENMAIKTVDANGIAWYKPTKAPFRLVDDWGRSLPGNSGCCSVI